MKRVMKTTDEFHGDYITMLKRRRRGPVWAESVQVVQLPVAETQLILYSFE